MKPRTQLTGPCVECGSPDTSIEKSGLAHWYSGQDGIGTICKKCYQRKNREIPKPGKCVRCGVEETKQYWHHEEEGTICITCYRRVYTKKQRDGFCSICKATKSNGWENTEEHGKICKSCASQIRIRELKEECLSHYSQGSMKCNYCGFQNIDALQIDHIHGGGNKDRKEAGAFTDEVFSIFAEYDAGPVSVGIGYIPETIASPENKNEQVTSDTNEAMLTNTAKVDINDIMTIYALVDIPALGGSYLKFGWREATVETKESLDTGGSYNDVDVEGYSIALGYAFDTGSEGLSVRLEVEGAQYDDVEATNNADTSTKIKVSDLMSGSASISLVKSF